MLGWRKARLRFKTKIYLMYEKVERGGEGNGVRLRQVLVSTVTGREQDAVSISLTVNEHRRRNGLERRRDNKIRSRTTLSALHRLKINKIKK